VMLSFISMLSGKAFVYNFTAYHDTGL